MLAYHQARQADVTVGVIRVPMKEAHRFGTATIGPEGRIREFVEKSSNPASNIASMGIYVFNRRYLEEQLKEDARNPNSPHDFGYAIIPGSVKSDRVFGYEFEGYWRDIGTVEAYYETNMQLLEEEPGFAIDDIRPVLTLDRRSTALLTNVPGNIVNSLVSPGCVIEGYVENSILSPGVHVSEKARVINSVVMADTRIGYHSIVDRCILDEGVDIDKFCYIGFGTTPMPQVGDITLVGKDVNLGPQTAIGRKSKILPGIKLADLNPRVVAPGTVVSVPL
jgi:glucose-1-phosphate adenylyltransferase